MYNILSITLIMLAFAVPFVCICFDLRRKLWPVMVSVLCCGCFAVLQIGILIWRLKKDLQYGFSVISEAVFFVSIVVAAGTLISSLIYLVISYGKWNWVRSAGLCFLIVGLTISFLLTALKLPLVYKVDSHKTVHGYVLGEEQPQNTYDMRFKGTFTMMLWGNDYYEGDWFVYGRTNGWEPITTFSPDDRPYKNLTRYDPNGEKLTGPVIQIFGNAKFTDYVMMILSETEKETVLCTEAPNYQALVETAERNNIGYFGNYYKEQGEVFP